MPSSVGNRAKTATCCRKTSSRRPKAERSGWLTRSSPPRQPRPDCCEDADGATGTIHRDVPGRAADQEYIVRRPSHLVSEGHVAAAQLLQTGGDDDLIIIAGLSLIHISE